MRAGANGGACAGGGPFEQMWPPGCAQVRTVDRSGRGVDATKPHGGRRGALHGIRTTFPPRSARSQGTTKRPRSCPPSHTPAAPCSQERTVSGVHPHRADPAGRALSLAGRVWPSIPSSCVHPAGRGGIRAGPLHSAGRASAKPQAPPAEERGVYEDRAVRVSSTDCI